MYEERPSSIPGAVAWTATTADAAGDVLPDGCMDLLWLDDRLVIAGPDAVAHRAEATPGSTVAGVRFAPGAMPALLGLPAHALRDQRVALGDVWAPSVVRDLEEQVAAAPDRRRALEVVAADRLRRAEPVAPLIPAVAEALAAGEPVAAVADRVGLGARQLHRRSLDAFGYGPKVLARVLRLQRALGLARSGVALVDVALTAGYADQAHLARDVRALTGRTLTQLAA